MLAGLPVALAFAALAAADVPAPSSAPPAQAKPADDACAPQRPPNDREIVICAERQEGYRIDPDILSVKRAKRGGRPVRPGPESIPDTAACTVGSSGSPTRAGSGWTGSPPTSGTPQPEGASS